jgi:predicted phage-related endonuclease
MKIHNITQGTQEWHDFRLAHFGASEAAAMLGLSKSVTRSELLHAKCTGDAKSFSDWVQRNILNYGHEVEALARQILESEIFEDLYAVTCSEGDLSASCDGLTIGGDTAFEHKQWNQALADSVRAGILPDPYWPQCQQVLMITGAEKLIFVVSDGTTEKREMMIVLPDRAKWQILRDGWDQFKRDLESYTPPALVVEPTGRAPDALPALRIEVSGMVNASNLDAFKRHALSVFSEINENLQTDSDFADADKAAKWCKDVESRLEAAKNHALSQTESIDALFRAIDEIKEEARQKRLTLEKLVKSRKENIRAEKVAAAQAKFSAVLAELNSGVEHVQINHNVGWYDAIKGLKSLSSMQDALDTALANATIIARNTAIEYREKLTIISANPQFSMLFPDLQALIVKPLDDFSATVNLRISRAKEQERELKEKREQALIASAAAVAAPAPSVVVAVEIAAAPVAESAAKLRLGQINELLSPLQLTAETLAALGFNPVAVEKSAKLYNAGSFADICNALLRHISDVRDAKKGGV